MIGLAKKTINRGIVFADGSDVFNSFFEIGYTPLNKNPEIIAGINKIAELIGSMSIHLKQETDRGNIRVINGLSRFVDITPCKTMIRSNWIQVIVKNLLLYGDGNAVVVPKSKKGLLDDLMPLPPHSYNILNEGMGYSININGARHDPQDLLHFVYNPSVNEPYKGEGYKVVLKDLVSNLSQARATEKGFLANPLPPIIIKVDSTEDALSTEEGRDKVANKFLKNKEEGKPWLLPAEEFQVESVKPLTLADLALSDTYKLNKMTVASILKIPPFLLGVGNFKTPEWDNFINTTIMGICRVIEQELTKKLLLSPELFFTFNLKSLHSYDMKRIASTMSSLYKMGIVTGNEVRQSIGLTPLDGLDKLIILENFIHMDKIDEQLKLIQKGKGDDDDYEDEGDE